MSPAHTESKTKIVKTPHSHVHLIEISNMSDIAMYVTPNAEAADATKAILMSRRNTTGIPKIKGINSRTAKWRFSVIHKPIAYLRTSGLNTEAMDTNVATTSRMDTRSAGHRTGMIPYRST